MIKLDNLKKNLEETDSANFVVVDSNGTAVYERNCVMKVLYKAFDRRLFKNERQAEEYNKNHGRSRVPVRKILGLVIRK